MTDRDKVIEHIADCVHIADCQVNHDWVFTRADILRDVLALLKAQEPRVLTLEEVDNILSGYIVLQTRNMSDMLEWYDGLLFCVNINWTVDIITLEGKKRLKKDDYGETWRVWNNRPTKEQREGTPWDC